MFHVLTFIVNTFVMFVLIHSFAEKQTFPVSGLQSFLTFQLCYTLQLVYLLCHLCALYQATV